MKLKVFILLSLKNHRDDIPSSSFFPSQVMGLRRKEGCACLLGIIPPRYSARAPRQGEMELQAPATCLHHEEEHSLKISR